MSWYVEQFRSPASISVLRKQYRFNVAVAADRIDLHTHLKVARQGNYLNMISVNIKLFDLSCAKTGDVTPNKVLIQNRILLQVTRRKPTNIHD